MRWSSGENKSDGEKKSNIHNQRGVAAEGGEEVNAFGERRDAEITRERGERIRVADIGFAILIFGAEIKRTGEHCK